ncbi:hypothetical protein ACTXT7_008207 [Hymenolepis weldensis]
MQEFSSSLLISEEHVLLLSQKVPKEVRVAAENWALEIHVDRRTCGIEISHKNIAFFLRRSHTAGSCAVFARILKLVGGTNRAMTKFLEETRNYSDFTILICGVSIPLVFYKTWEIEHWNSSLIVAPDLQNTYSPFTLCIPEQP